MGAELAELEEPSLLPWGWRYLMVEPSHFRVDYAINPFMDPARPPDPDRARAQWEDLVGALEEAGATSRCSRSARTPRTWSTR